MFDNELAASYGKKAIFLLPSDAKAASSIEYDNKRFITTYAISF
jgi:hypothetical protein